MSTAKAMQSGAARSTSGRHFGHRGMLISAGTGFALGVLVAAAFIPFFNPKATTRHHNPIPTPVPFSRAEMRDHVTSAANNVLGRYGGSGPEAGQERLKSLRLTPILLRHFPGFPTDMFLYNVSMRFLLEPNAVGTSIQTGGAETDCFEVLQALYSENLPVENIDLYGMFQFPGQTSAHIVLHAGSDPAIENQVNIGVRSWGSLDRGDYTKVWQYLRPHWISYRFTHYKP